MLSVTNARHAYPGAPALELPDLKLAVNDDCLLLGPSGSGKTTLLHAIGALLELESGSVVVDGTPLDTLKGTAREFFRGRNIGMVFQRLHLIGSLTVRQNLRAAQYCAGLAPDESRIDDVLASLGLTSRAEALPSALSQGQAQRVAIGRAIVNRPKLILADEPTSSLDDHNAAGVLALLQTHARSCNAVLIIATHDARAKAVIERRIELACAA